MEIKLLLVGAVLVILGVIRHLAGASMPKLGFQLVRFPAWAIAGLGVVLAIAGFLVS